MEAIEKFVELVNQAERIVFFGGAGVSTESGIPDFRSVDGLYNQQYKYPPEQILSYSFYDKRTREFYEFYRDKLLIKGVEPNIVHKKLAELEQKGKLTAVITQNIDGLHQLAGSKNVLELHGSIHRNYCTRCGEFYDLEYIEKSEGVPLCSECGGRIKPAVVLYQEMLNKELIAQAIEYIKNADILIIGGTSLEVYPAAGLIDYFEGGNIVLINKDETKKDSVADLVIHEKLGDVFRNL